MNETERDRILRMVAEGTLRPHEAAHLLAALADEPGAAKDEPKPGPKSERRAQNLMEVQMERPDGSNYTIKVPPSLVPMLWEITKATVRESARTAAQETWDGLKNIVRKQTKQVTNSVRERFSPKGKAELPQVPVPAISAAEKAQADARKQVLEMVASGTIGAEDAGRLIQQLDAHLAYSKKLGDATGRPD